MNAFAVVETDTRPSIIAHSAFNLSNAFITVDKNQSYWLSKLLVFYFIVISMTPGSIC